MHLIELKTDFGFESEKVQAFKNRQEADNPLGVSDQADVIRKQSSRNKIKI